jgi:hypothetical protein
MAWSHPVCACTRLGRAGLVYTEESNCEQPIHRRNVSDTAVDDAHLNDLPVTGRARARHSDPLRRRHGAEGATATMMWSWRSVDRQLRISALADSTSDESQSWAMQRSAIARKASGPGSEVSECCFFCDGPVRNNSKDACPADGGWECCI